MYKKYNNGSSFFTVDKSENVINVVGRNMYNQTIVHIFIKDNIIFKEVSNEFIEIGKIDEVIELIISTPSFKQKNIMRQ